MSSPALTSPTPLPHGADVRLLSRVSVAFLLDMIAIHRSGGHVLDTLLMAAISQANVAEITRRADLQLAYARLEDVPPDELRRPISLNALAISLSLPYETIRRRVTGLAWAGLVQLRPGGAVVPAKVVNSTPYREMGLKAFERTRSFYDQLRELRLIGAPPPSQARLAADALPVRLMARLTSDYLLRVVEAAITPMSDLVGGLIFLETFRSNVEHLPLEPWGGADLKVREMVPDEVRRPVTVSALAVRLGLPYETVRRHVARLEDKALLQRPSRGLIAPAIALGRPELRAAMIANVSDLQRLFGRLAELGVLDLWDRSR